MNLAAAARAYKLALAFVFVGCGALDEPVFPVPVMGANETVELEVDYTRFSLSEETYPGTLVLRGTRSTVYGPRFLDCGAAVAVISGTLRLEGTELLAAGVEANTAAVASGSLVTSACDRELELQGVPLY